MIRPWVILIVLGLAILPAAAQFEDPLVWVRQFGTKEQDDAFAVYTDGENTYVAGYVTVYDKQAKFSRIEALVTKFNDRGKELWRRQYRAMLNLWATAVTGDDSGIYVAVYGMGNAYLRKLDHEGTELWNVPIGEYNTGDEVAWGIARDDTGIYVTGYTTGIVDGPANAGGVDTFLVKCDHAGNLIWKRQWGTDGLDYAYGISVDAGGISIVGNLQKWLAGNFLADAFLVRYDLSGNVRWTRQFGSPEWDTAQAVTADRKRIFVVGDTNGTLTKKPNSGGSDGFIRCYDFDGEVLWTRAIRTRQDDTARGVAIYDGQVYVAGTTTGTFADQESYGMADGYLRCYDKFEGTQEWTLQFGSPGYDTVRALSVKAGALAIAGQVENAAMPRQHAIGAGDAFVIRAIID